MQQFIKRICLFLIPLLIGFGALEYSLRLIPNDYAYKNEYLNKYSDKIEVLILGNSHAYRGVIPENINLNTFNAAYISQSLDLDFLIFNKYKKDLKKLKFIVINISYPSLFGSLKESKEDWRIKNYNLYYDFRITLTPKNYSELLGNKYDVNKKKWMNYYLDDKTLKTTTLLGGGQIYRNNNKKESGIKAAKRHTKKGLPYYKEYLNELNNILKDARINNFNLIFITTPTYKYYANNLDIKQLNLMNYIVDSLTINNSNVYRLNLLKSEDYLYEDFSDPDHLNNKGAEKFTKKLNNFIESLSY